MLLLTGCTASYVGPQVRTGEAAYNMIPAPSADQIAREYTIGPLDTLDIAMFNEPAVSSKGIPVDAVGNVALPLIGRVRASGMTATDLATSLEKLYDRYYVKPQITVVVTSSVSQHVTVQGDVMEPGVYEFRGTTTLLDTVSLAKGESPNAKLREVIVIRYVDGKRMAAAFDLTRIRSGIDPDPAILGRDVIIVGHSNSKQAWNDLLKAAPLLNVFAQF
ncbi:polysaccharide biosynthesis/export family protein [Novosphingobium sp. Rr 2-17]|uniref:polysaccharide biosynthesis/export family protein n=1 Tax=Novosphingobium sp. Rr 2-17 TaxID=555793 RepID=UPI0003046014|nr:polysaccharide biosynthesis/export family protein [Novosphingobium sp. Rr 2-17]